MDESWDMVTDGGDGTGERGWCLISDGMLSQLTVIKLRTKNDL